MDGIPVIGFSAYSGTGKTTLIEKLISSLKARGLRVAAIKHDAHGFEIDREGKDSRRFSDAGADISIINSSEQTAVIERRGLDFDSAAALARDVDIILVEGFKHGRFTHIGLSRSGSGLTGPPDSFAAIVTDEDIECGCPKFSFEDIDAITEFIMQNMKDFTHFDAEGRARMVDVGGKEPTLRTAVAAARVQVSPETFELIRSGGMKKGDVLATAQIAGVMGAKRTSELIPMCHNLQINGAKLDLRLDASRCSVEITAAVNCHGRTGVEMEALTAASVAALTVYDMCKAVQKDIVITDIRLLEKTGGVHGDYLRKDEET